MWLRALISRMRTLIVNSNVIVLFTSNDVILIPKFCRETFTQMKFEHKEIFENLVCYVTYTMHTIFLLKCNILPTNFLTIGLHVRIKLCPISS